MNVIVTSACAYQCPCRCFACCWRGLPSPTQWCRCQQLDLPILSAGRQVSSITPSVDPDSDAVTTVRRSPAIRSHSPVECRIPQSSERVRYRGHIYAPDEKRLRRRVPAFAARSGVAVVAFGRRGPLSERVGRGWLGGRERPHPCPVRPPRQLSRHLYRHDGGMAGSVSRRGTGGAGETPELDDPEQSLRVPGRLLLVDGEQQ